MGCDPVSPFFPILNSEDFMLTPNQKKIIDLLIKQEKLLARLYTIFYDKLPEHRDFWKKIAKEEHHHAKWLERLYEAGGKDVVHFDEGKITTVSLETFIKGVEEAIRKAEADELDDKMALVQTVDLERSLIEKNVFSQFSGLTDKAKNVMKFLEKHTKEHLSQAENLLRQVLSS